MKRLYILFLVFAVSCAEVSTYEPREVGIDAFSTPSTKGYVVGENLSDTPSLYLHGGGTDFPRKLYLTTWHYNSVGGESEYFREREFFFDENGVVEGCWRGNPAAYWPNGGHLDFAGYSVGIPFEDGQVSWGRGRSTDEFSFNVSRVYTQDDILFSSRLFVRSADSDGKVAMQFFHAQAWLQVVLHSVPECADIVTLHRVVFKDVYTSGRLTVTHPFGFAEGDWTFLNDESRDTDIDDLDGVFGTKMTAEPRYLDWLIPGQPMKSMVIYYSLSGSDLELQYEYAMPVTEWLSGRKYVYDVTFAPHGIELLPSILDWNGVVVEP